MKKRKFKKGFIVSLYLIAFVSVLGSIYLVEMGNRSADLDEKTIYVNDDILDSDKPVISVTDTIIRPYNASNIIIGKTFYEYNDTKENQVNSLIYYEGTYLPNSGVDYKSEEIFDVISILDGVVTNITENNLLGKILEITHDNNIITVYQSLGEINVSLNDPVIQGQIIGKSGNSNISVDLGNHLHFELIHNGLNVNPEKYYDKKLNEI